MFLEIIDKFEVNGDILIVIECERTDELVEVFDEVAEDGDLVFLGDQVNGIEQQFFLELIVLSALVEQGEALL